MHLNLVLGCCDLGTCAQTEGAARGVVEPLQLELNAQLLLRARRCLAELKLLFELLRRLLPPTVHLCQFRAQAQCLPRLRLPHAALPPSELRAGGASLLRQPDMLLALERLEQGL